jgi:hypothetical protein
MTAFRRCCGSGDGDIAGYRRRARAAIGAIGVMRESLRVASAVIDRRYKKAFAA